ncbi:MAG: efflux RND transporter periplasmic adaptor subunit [Patescibacteria group bacterium]|jgi:HlyD family secretion protein
MKLFKRKWFWAVIIIIILVIIGGGYYISTKNSANKVVYTTENAKIGNITQTVSATGAVESAHEISLNFKVFGKITYLPVKEGDTVKSEQVLAKIDSSSASTVINQYRAALLAAKADLAKTKAGASSEDINLSQKQLDKAISDLNSLKLDSASQLNSLREKALDAINNSNLSSQTALDKVYNYFLNTQTTSGLVVSDQNSFNQVRDAYYNLDKKIDDTKSLISTANSAKTDDSIIKASDGIRADMAKINNFLDDVYNLANSIVTNTSYPQTTKDAIKTDINVQSSAISTAITALQLAKLNLTNAISSFNSQIQAGQSNVEIYTAQLAVKKSGPRSFDIQSAEAAVAQAQARLDGAMSDLGDYSLKAPIDGKIVTVNYNVGEQTSASKPVVIMLSNETFQIKVDIPESDIAKVKIGDKVKIDLDAFGSDHPFSGAVTFIEPAQTTIQDVIYYKTTVVFDNDPLINQIKPGMSANVSITTAQKSDVLYIPQRAVKIKEITLDQKVADKYVEVLVSLGVTEQRIVTVGLKADGGLVEILSGLNEGDKVVTFKK